MNRQCNLTKRVHTAGGSRYCPVVLSANGRVKPDWVLVTDAEGKSHEQRHPEGNYYLDWREGKTRFRKSVGKDAGVANAARIKQEQVLAAKNAGIKVVEQPQSDGMTLTDAADVWLRDIEATKRLGTLLSYKKSIDYFLDSCSSRARVTDVRREDLIQFRVFLDKKGMTARTIRNKFMHVVTFLKASGVRGLVSKGDWPSYDEDEPEIFEPEDLDKFFAACDDDERLCYQFFLMTGMREQEVAHAEWPDVNFSRGVVIVRSKPEYGFATKTRKGREIPIPTRLVAALKLRRQGAGLLFSTNGRPRTTFIYHLKAIVERAGLDPRDWWLHKFRATFATTALRTGVDLRTVQDWMGHKDLKSTMRYLKPARGAAVRAKVDQMFA